MSLLLLHFDDALERQSHFIAHCEGLGAQSLDVKHAGAQIRLWGKNAALNPVGQALVETSRKQGNQANLVFMGSGDFHHVTSLLLAAAVEKHSDPITVIHLDNHPDWVNFTDGAHCGSWVNRALALPQIQKVITIGVDSKDLTLPEWRGANLDQLRQGRLELYPFETATSRVRKSYGENACFEQKANTLHWKTLAGMGLDAFIPYLLTRIQTRNVYITVDKDVFATGDALTNWDQGKLPFDYALKLIAAVAEQHHIIGADVTGDYSAPVYTGPVWVKALKRGEILLDQPRQSADAQQIETTNTRSNLQLLNQLSEAMA